MADLRKRVIKKGVAVRSIILQEFIWNKKPETKFIIIWQQLVLNRSILEDVD